MCKCICITENQVEELKELICDKCRYCYMGLSEDELEEKCEKCSAIHFFSREDVLEGELYE